MARARKLSAVERQLGLPLPTGGGRLAYRCMDWSERQDHLAGTLALIGQPYQARRELEFILESNQTAVDTQVLEQAIRDLQETAPGTEG